MSRVTKCELPAHAKIYAQVQPEDFLDCYACESHLSAKDATTCALQLPGWANVLVRLRNRVMAPFGLKTQQDDGASSPAMFPITYQSADEVQMGFDDSHLDFRVTVLKDAGKVYMSTWVHRNNLLGRIYLPAILPFHVLIVRNSLARVARHA